MGWWSRQQRLRFWVSGAPMATSQRRGARRRWRPSSRYCGYGAAPTHSNHETTRSAAILHLLGCRRPRRWPLPHQPPLAGHPLPLPKLSDCHFSSPVSRKKMNRGGGFCNSSCTSHTSDEWIPPPPPSPAVAAVGCTATCGHTNLSFFRGFPHPA